MRKNELTKVERAVADRVVQAREAAGISRKQIADALGLEENGYGHYERYRTRFSVDQLFTVARVVGRPVTWLLGIRTELNLGELELVHLYQQLPNDTARKLVLESVRAQVRLLTQE